MSTTTVDGFVEVLERSELLTADQLAEVRQQVDSTGDVKAAALSLIQKQLLTTWQAKLILAGRHTFKLGKYVLCDRLGEEELGDVYLAKHVQLGRTVAIKTLSREVTQEGNRLKSFLAEAREIAKLDHRNITHLFDINCDGDRYFLVMERIEGRTLAKLVEEEGPIDRNIVAGYIRQAANALAHAHEKGILHRRVNPTNLIVDKNGVIKLQNLGISGLLGSADKETDADVTMGGEFLAPEQRSSGPIDVRTDIYGLGATAMYLLTGELPQSIEQDPQSVLDKIFRKMTAAQPKDRFKSADQIAKYLSKWIEENPAVVAEAEPAEEDPLAEAAAAEEGFPGIAIDTGSKHKSNGAKPAAPKEKASTESAIADDSTTRKPPVKNSRGGDGFLGMDFAASSDTLSSPITTKASFKKGDAGEKRKTKIPTIAILGIVGAGLATLLLFGAVVGGMLYWLMSGSDDQVAQNNAGAVSAASSSDQTGDSEADTSSANVPAPESTEENAEPEEEVDPDELPPLGALPMNVSQEATVNVEPPKPAGDQSANTSPADPASPTPMPTEPPKPEGDPKAAPEPTPTPPEPTPPKPTPPKKPVDPFKGLQKSVDIPIVGDSQSEPFDKVVEIGIAELGPVDFLDVRLIGGDQVHKSKKLFQLRNGLGGTSLRDFEIYLTGPKDSNDAELMVAKLWFDEKQLKFQWTDKAKEDPTCNYLRNCTVSLLTGASATDVKLRKPVKLEPIVFDFEKGASGETSAPKLEWLPDLAMVNIKVEFEAAKELPNRFDPGQEFAALKGSANILLGGELTLAGGARMHTSSIELESSAGRTMQVSATLNVNYPGGRGKKLYTPSRYVEKKLDSLRKELGQNQAKLAVFLVEYNKAKDKEAFNRELLRGTGIVNLTQTVKDVDAMISEYEKLQTQYVEQVKNSMIKVRIYHTVGDPATGEYQVVLAE